MGDILSHDTLLFCEVWNIFISSGVIGKIYNVALTPENLLDMKAETQCPHLGLTSFKFD